MINTAIFSPNTIQQAFPCQLELGNSIVWRIIPRAEQSTCLINRPRFVNVSHLTANKNEAQP